VASFISGGKDTGNHVPKGDQLYHFGLEFATILFSVGGLLSNALAI
jgi:hypothetical protein